MVIITSFCYDNCFFASYPRGKLVKLLPAIGSLIFCLTNFFVIILKSSYGFKAEKYLDFGCMDGVSCRSQNISFVLNFNLERTHTKSFDLSNHDIMRTFLGLYQPRHTWMQNSLIPSHNTNLRINLSSKPSTT